MMEKIIRTVAVTAAAFGVMRICNKITNRREKTPEMKKTIKSVTIAAFVFCGIGIAVWIGIMLMMAYTFAG